MRRTMGYSCIARMAADIIGNRKGIDRNADFKI